MKRFVPRQKRFFGARLLVWFDPENAELWAYGGYTLDGGYPLSPYTTSFSHRQNHSLIFHHSQHHRSMHSIDSSLCSVSHSELATNYINKSRWKGKNGKSTKAAGWVASFSTAMLPTFNANSITNSTTINTAGVCNPWSKVIESDL